MNPAGLDRLGEKELPLCDASTGCNRRSSASANRFSQKAFRGGVPDLRGMALDKEGK